MSFILVASPRYSGKVSLRKLDNFIFPGPMFLGVVIILGWVMISLSLSLSHTHTCIIIPRGCYS